MHSWRWRLYSGQAFPEGLQSVHMCYQTALISPTSKSILSGRFVLYAEVIRKHACLAGKEIQYLGCVELHSLTVDSYEPAVMTNIVYFNVSNK